MSDVTSPSPTRVAVPGLLFKEVARRDRSNQVRADDAATDGGSRIAQLRSPRMVPRRRTCSAAAPSSSMGNRTESSHVREVVGNRRRDRRRGPHDPFAELLGTDLPKRLRARRQRSARERTAVTAHAAATWSPISSSCSNRKHRSASLSRSLSRALRWRTGGNASAERPWSVPGAKQPKQCSPGSEVTYVRRSSTARTAPAAATSSRPWGALPHEKTNPGLLQGRFNVPVLAAPAGLEPATERLEVCRTTQSRRGL